MRRAFLCLGLAATLVALVVAPVSAVPKQPTGDRISITLDCWDNCGAPQTFPAGAPFYISHGHGISKAFGENPAIGKYLFTLDVDGVPVAANFKQITSAGHGDHGVLWTFNFPDGMTGIHYFTGTWYVPCGGYTNTPPCDGHANAVVEAFDPITVPVTFL
jgi:hypothetical protein